MNNKGQALVEFILIIPIFMFILLGIIDISNIITNKYKLEDNLNVIVELYQNNDKAELSSYINKENITIDYEIDNKYTKIIVKRIVSIKTPILNNILGRQKEIDATRTIYNE